MSVTTPCVYVCNYELSYDFVIDRCGVSMCSGSGEGVKVSRLLCCRSTSTVTDWQDNSHRRVSTQCLLTFSGKHGDPEDRHKHQHRHQGHHILKPCNHVPCAGRLSQHCVREMKTSIHGTLSSRKPPPSGLRACARRTKSGDLLTKLLQWTWRKGTTVRET